MPSLVRTGYGDYPIAGRLGAIKPAATTETIIYASPTDVKYVRNIKLYVTEQNAAAATFRISITTHGGTTAANEYIFYNYPLAPSSTVILDDLALPANTDIRAFCSTADVSFAVTGTEVY
jgi:hypothetical protein